MKERSDIRKFLLTVYSLVGEEVHDRPEQISAHFALQDHVALVEEHISHLGEEV